MKSAESFTTPDSRASAYIPKLKGVELGIFVEQKSFGNDLAPKVSSQNKEQCTPV